MQYAHKVPFRTSYFMTLGNSDNSPPDGEKGGMERVGRKGLLT